MEAQKVCSIARHLADTPEPYKSALVRLLANDGFSGGLSADVAAKTMRQAGLKTSATAIRLHRAGTCICS
jgi:hypothetical protein